MHSGNLFLESSNKNLFLFRKPESRMLINLHMLKYCTLILFFLTLKNVGYSQQNMLVLRFLTGDTLIKNEKNSNLLFPVIRNTSFNFGSYSFSNGGWFCKYVSLENIRNITKPGINFLDILNRPLPKYRIIYDDLNQEIAFKGKFYADVEAWDELFGLRHGLFLRSKGYFQTHGKMDARSMKKLIQKYNPNNE